MPESSHDQEKYMTPLIREPKGAIAKFFWRIWIWIGTTFVFSLLEPWEQVLVCAVFFIMLSLLSVGLFSYFPRYVVVAISRAHYYLYGTDSIGKEYVPTRPRGTEL